LRIDSHHHLWRYNATDYVWMDERMVSLRRDFLPEDLERTAGVSGIEGSVVVQARQSVEETEFLLTLAATTPVIRGVVGWVDLRSPVVQRDLERFSANPLLRGVRHVIHDEPDERFILGRAFRAGIELLRRYGLTYDLLLRPPHLPHAVAVVEAMPDQPFVIDHIAKPDILRATLEPWREGMRALAAHENVFCKISGMVTEADWETWRYEELAPYMEAVLELFGPERIMFGSDWPVCTLAADYGRVVGIVERFIEPLTPDEKEAIMGRTAQRFYGL
jgi:L-fuconolactonase